MFRLPLHSHTWTASDFEFEEPVDGTFKTWRGGSTFEARWRAFRKQYPDAATHILVTFALWSDGVNVTAMGRKSAHPLFAVLMNLMWELRFKYKVSLLLST